MTYFSYFSSKIWLVPASYMLGFLFFFITVNEESFGFRLLVGQKSLLKTSLWSLGNCNEHFAELFLTFYISND